MLFEIVHTHTPENCPGSSPEKAKAFGDWWLSAKKAPGIKILTGYVSPLDHTFYITVEADDYPTLAKAFGYLVGLGVGRTQPILTLDQTVPLAGAGVFQVKK